MFDSGLTLEYEVAFILGKLKENREKHIKEYAEAKEIYMKALAIKLEEALALVKDGKDIHLTINLEKPVNHEKDYDKTISMLSQSCNKTIQLGSDQFTKFIEDDWEWKDRFLSNSMTYKSMKL
jgi:hypothetical protein